jgi:hypothetical protein
MEPIGCPETPVRNYDFTLRNIPEERSSHPLRGTSLKSRTVFECLDHAKMGYVADVSGGYAASIFSCGRN